MKLLFEYPNSKEGFIRLGEFGFICRACYYRGKELGYGDISIEWPDIIEFTRNHHLKRNKRKPLSQLLKLKCPINTILPMTFVDKDKIDLSDYDKIIDINERGAFYGDSEPIFLEINGKQTRSNRSQHEFLNKYYVTYGEYPIFNVEKDKLQYKYVLVHTRNALNSRRRNPKVETYLYMLELIKDNFSDYKIFRCGETYNKDIENKFNEYVDEFYPPMEDFDRFLRLINNASFYVGCPSGPIEYAKSFNLPIIELDIPKYVWDTRSSGIYSSDKYNYYSKDYWEKVFHGEWGETIEDNINQDRIMKMYRNGRYEKMDILKFIERWTWN